MPTESVAQHADIDEYAMTHMDAYFSIVSPENKFDGTDVPVERQAAFRRGRGHLHAAGDRCFDGVGHLQFPNACARARCGHAAGALSGFCLWGMPARLGHARRANAPPRHADAFDAANEVQNCWAKAPICALVWRGAKAWWTMGM